MHYLNYLLVLRRVLGEITYNLGYYGNTWYRNIKKNYNLKAANLASPYSY